jgi:quercetin dioxygenase-like cupin family protein
MTQQTGTGFAVAGGDMTAMRIGARVQTLRVQHEWSIRGFADRVGVAQDVVSTIEAGLRLPTIELLYRLASALLVAPGELLPSQEERPRVDVHLPISGGPDSGSAQVIGGGPGNPTQTYLFELAAGETDGGFGTHRGEELLVVMEGEAVCSSLGEPDEIVRAGHSRVIDTHIPHSVRAGDAGPVKFLLVCTDACDECPAVVRGA